MLYESIFPDSNPLEPAAFIKEQALIKQQLEKLRRQHTENLAKLLPLEQRPDRKGKAEPNASRLSQKQSKGVDTAKAEAKAKAKDDKSAERSKRVDASKAEAKAKAKENKEAEQSNRVGRVHAELEAKARGKEDKDPKSSATGSSGDVAHDGPTTIVAVSSGDEAKCGPKIRLNPSCDPRPRPAVRGSPCAKPAARGCQSAMPAAKG